MPPPEPRPPQPLQFVRRYTLFLLVLLLSLSPFTASQRLSATSAPPQPPSVDLQPTPPAPPAPPYPSKRHSLPQAIAGFRFNARTPLPSPPLEEGHNPYADPSIEDLTLSPIVLAVTVDGHVHALKRETGQWVWTLHDDGGVALGGTTKEEQAKRAFAGEALGGPLVRGMGRKKAESGRGSTGNETGLLELGGEEEEEEDEVYVIEPHSQGDIYVYSRDASLPAGGVLQKLPLSMQQLVTLSPFTFPSDSSRMFVASKDTKLVGVDLRTGRLVGVFGSTAGWCEWDAKKEGRVRTEEECDEEISRRPEDLLYMARTEYHLSIYSKASASLLQTLSYTTYSSSSLGTSLQSQWTRTPDDRYLQPTHEGSLICFLSGVTGIQWTIAFDVPVVSVFDIALPPNGPDKGETAQPIMLEQPHPLPADGLPRDFRKLQVLPDAAFIGSIDGDLFAMSRDNFPLIAFAPVNGVQGAAEGIDAGVGEEENETDPDQERPEAGVCRGVKCILGRHQLLAPVSESLDNGIDPPTEVLGIDAAPSSPSPTLPTSSTRAPTPHTPNHSSILASLSTPLRDLSTGNSATLGVFLLAVLGYLYARKLWSTKTQNAVEAKVRAFGKEWLETKRPSSDSAFDASLPPTPAEPSLPPFDELPLSPPATTLSPLVAPPLLPSLSSSPPLLGASKKLPPLPPVDEGGDDGEGESDAEAKEGVDGTPKKKGRRRRGKKTKKGPKIEEMTPVVLFAEGEGMDKELSGISLADVEVKEEASEGEVVVVADPHLIGGLSVSETILGYGSHGTVVLRGEFQGRAVAVKRLLKDFVTIATHEVALLQESDDHPHVIRYFCKEQRDTFLYIALELCPASLYDLIDQPLSFPDLVRDLEPKRALRQITGGIRHLHKLKIVHRDIKPQNILVSTSKHGGVRMLISDFGLCKKLDMDESSFQQTVNHAAGSFGYRAPEVLRGQVDPNAGAGGTPSSSTVDSRHGNPSTGSGTNADPAMRLTRSIDIFSLGCIFYYVLTGGEHPFGGRYEREMNILRGKVSLERLDGLGEEALEVQDLITRMVATDPRERPSAEAVLLHPFFWNAQKRLLFICDASDRFEIMDRDPPTLTLVSLESGAKEIVGDDWQKAIDRSLLENLGKYRKYDGTSVRDLLRVLRNKKHHYQDLPESVRTQLGDLPGGFLSYFTTRFPRLLLHVYDTVSTHLSDDSLFAATFGPDDSTV